MDVVEIGMDLGFYVETKSWLDVLQEQGNGDGEIDDMELNEMKSALIRSHDEEYGNRR
jgi:hypothetical protein